MKTKYIAPSIIKYEDGDGEYILSFDDLGCVEKTFEKIEIIPDGHVWEDVIISYCDENEVDITEIEFDSESDLFSAYSENKNSLERIIGIIDILISKPKILSNILENIELENDDNIWSASEFIEHLIFNDIDLTQPIELMLDIEFKQLESAKKAGAICVADGYKCFIDERDHEVLFMGVTKLKPIIQEIESRIEYFQNIANQLDGKFEYYNVYNEEFDHPVSSTYGSTWAEYK